MPNGGGVVQLSVIDGFELRVAGTAVELAPACQRLVAFLALWERPVTRSFIGGSLWTGSDDGHAGASLRSALWRLPSRVLVRATPTHLALGDGVAVDYREVVRWSTTVLAGTLDVGPSPWTVPRIAALTGEVLPDWYDDWVLPTRERYRQLRLHALESLCERLAESGRFGEALLAGLGAVVVEPLRESAHRRVIDVHLREGNVVEALRQYRSYERMLRDELSLEPSPDLRARVAPLLRGAARLA